VANTLKSFRNGAVGFIDWLGVTGRIGRKSSAEKPSHGGREKQKDDGERNVENTAECHAECCGKGCTSDEAALRQVYEFFGKVTNLHYDVQEKCDTDDANECL